jgi:hypothetical protein
MWFGIAPMSKPGSQSCRVVSSAFCSALVCASLARAFNCSIADKNALSSVSKVFVALQEWLWQAASP